MLKIRVLTLQSIIQLSFTSRSAVPIICSSRAKIGRDVSSLQLIEQQVPKPRPQPQQQVPPVQGIIKEDPLMIGTPFPITKAVAAKTIRNKQQSKAKETGKAKGK